MNSNKQQFNVSQLEVLKEATKMISNDILLVQGPPGTGKTNTITQLMMMLVFADEDVKIHVCAPSNAAVDEILMRMASKGLDQYTEEELTKKLLRVGAMSHVPD